MNLNHYIEQMATNAATIQQLTQGVSKEQARWKPAPDSWSILEVINHLYDEERSDFRVRLDHILRKVGGEFPLNNPQEWITERAYNERELQPSLENFLKEREASLQWLRDLESAEWDTLHTDQWGSIRAGDMFAAWVAHDILHLRQLVELHYAWTIKQLQPYDAQYAGEW